jgi:hypothetical protein
MNKIRNATDIVNANTIFKNIEVKSNVSHYAIHVGDYIFPILVIDHICDNT